MSGLGMLALASAVFVGSHFLLSHPLRAALIAKIGEQAFTGLYTLVALATFGWMIWAYPEASAESYPLWDAGRWGFVIATILMWLGSVLFMGSLRRNPAFPRPGKTIKKIDDPNGVYAITRHPMMWGFALWAIVHLLTVATEKAVVFDGAILVLSMGGSIGQDRKKAALMGERFHEWSAQTAFIPFTRGVANPGAVALIGGTLLFFVATWAHGALGAMPAGFWRWVG
jgi:uncharacterized membrane protein